MICPECGKEIIDNKKRFCPYCGRGLAAAEAKSAEQTEAEKGRNPEQKAEETGPAIGEGTYLLGAELVGAKKREPRKPLLRRKPKADFAPERPEEAEVPEAPSTFEGFELTEEPKAADGLELPEELKRSEEPEGTDDFELPEELKVAEEVKISDGLELPEEMKTADDPEMPEEFKLPEYKAPEEPVEREASQVPEAAKLSELSMAVEKPQMPKRTKANKKLGKGAKVAIAAAALAVLAIAAVVFGVPYLRYSSAMKLYREGDYVQAMNAFKAMDYKDSAQMALNCEAAENAEVEKAIEAAKAAEAEKAAKAAEEAAQKAAEEKAAKAAEEAAKQEAEEAAKAAEEAAKKEAEEAAKKAAEIPSDLAVGDVLSLGSYEQDDNESDGKEPIEWLVIAKEGDKVLLLSRYALDQVAFHEEYAFVGWDGSDLRSWLNGSFLETAFNEAEQAKILPTAIPAAYNPYTMLELGEETEDRIFVPDVAEAEEYIIETADFAKVTPTAYAAARGVYVYKNGNCYFWLRSPGDYKAHTACVNEFGKLAVKKDVCDAFVAVRPAMWVSLG